MPPALFNIYSEEFISKAFEGMSGILTGKQRINTINYVNDQAIIAESEDDL